MIENEYILCAAIWVNDQIVHKNQPINIKIGFVVCGRRHGDCYQTISDLKGDANLYFKDINMSEDDYRSHQGFMTSSNRYVNRHEGWIIAKKNNQIKFGLKASENGDDSILISENLYND